MRATKMRVSLLAVAAAALFTTVLAQQAPPRRRRRPAGAPSRRARGAGPRPRRPRTGPVPDVPPMKVYIYGGPKTHGEGQHDYPQFLADWSKILQNRGAEVDGGLHFPSARELAGVDVLVIYKGDAGYVSLEDRANLDQYLRRGGGIVSLHDALCSDDTGVLRQHRRRREEARRGQLHARSERAVHDRRQGAPDHEGHGGLQDHRRGVLPDDVVEDAGNPRPGDRGDRRHAERGHRTRARWCRRCGPTRSRWRRRRPGRRTAPSCGCRGTTTPTSRCPTCRR